MRAGTLDPDWNFHTDVEAAISGPPAAALQRLLEDRKLEAGLDSLRPKHPLYERLRLALQTYQQIEAAGDWPSVPEGAPLRPGASDPRLIPLRDRPARRGRGRLAVRRGSCDLRFGARVGRRPFPEAARPAAGRRRRKELFAADERPFSSGCIRVKEIVELTRLVLDDPETWSKEKLVAAIQTGRTQNVTLERRAPVLLTYWTAVVAPGDEQVRFYEDVYGRDPALLAALDSPFRFHRSVVRRAAAMSETR